MLLIDWLEALEDCKFCEMSNQLAWWHSVLCVYRVFSRSTLLEVEGTRLLKPGQDGIKAVILATRRN